MLPPRWAAAVVAGLLVAGCTNKTAVAPFRPESVTFVSADVGLVIGLSTCGDVRCMRLARTLDGGYNWTWVARVPGLTLDDGWRLRFADAKNGWISGPLLFATHDGGRTWTQIALPGLGSRTGLIGALEVADGRVFAEVAEGTDQDTYGPVVLFSTEVSRDSWAAVGNVATGSAGYPGEISVAQGAIWAMLHPGVVSQDHIFEARSVLYHSTDGLTWHSSLLPCRPQTVASVAAATSARVFIVCSGGVAAGSQSKSAYLSTDGGATYKRAGDPPLAGDFDAVAASPLALSVAVASGATYIYTSFNDGRDWVTTYLPQSGGLPLSDLSFTTPTQGVVIFGVPAYPQWLQLLMTRDGGHSWVTVGVTPS
jgi:photosystem II stability/assembly factor-like uncharacterized protein